MSLYYQSTTTVICEIALVKLCGCVHARYRGWYSISVLQYGARYPKSSLHTGGCFMFWEVAFSRSSTDIVKVSDQAILLKWHNCDRRWSYIRAWYAPSWIAWYFVGDMSTTQAESSSKLFRPVNIEASAFIPEVKNPVYQSTTMKNTGLWALNHHKVNLITELNTPLPSRLLDSAREA